MKVKSEREVAQLCPTLSDPMDCSPLGSSIHGIFQATILEWGAIAFSGISELVVTQIFLLGNKNFINLNLFFLTEWHFVSQILLTGPIKVLPNVVTFTSSSKIC